MATGRVRRARRNTWARPALVFVAVTVIAVGVALAAGSDQSSSSTSTSTSTSTSAPAPPRLVGTRLTSDAGDDFEIRGVGPGAIARALVTNTRGNTRIAFWRYSDPMARDAQSCATWTAESSSSTQEGVALRVAVSPEGTSRAITVTKNIYLRGTWIFNVHLWNTATDEVFAQIGSFDLSAAFGLRDRLSALPWSVCARVVDDQLTFVAWPSAGARPHWDDPRYGRTMVLPPGWDYLGAAGWYVGHLRPGASTTFTNLRTRRISGRP